MYDNCLTRLKQTKSALFLKTNRSRIIVSSFFDPMDLFQGDVDVASAKAIFEAVENALLRMLLALVLMGTIP